MNFWLKDSNINNWSSTYDIFGAKIQNNKNLKADLVIKGKDVYQISWRYQTLHDLTLEIQKKVAFLALKYKFHRSQEV